MSEAELKDFSRLFSLEGKVAVVTGGSRGLGLSAASAILQAGASRVFVTSRKAEACEEACRVLNALPKLAPGARAISVPADSSNLAGIRSLVRAVGAQTDHVDILLANAGATWGAPFDAHPDEAFAKVMDLNAFVTDGPMLASVREMAPLLERRASLHDPARVIITASVAGLGIGTLGKHGTYGYSASKAAVIHLGRNLAVELGPRHIAVNSIAPGFFPTRMANGLMTLFGGQERLAAANPLLRLGEPEDIAGVVVFLCSRAGAYLNAATIALDGGAMWARTDSMNMQETAKL